VHEYCATHGVPYTLLANATVPELLFNLEYVSSIVSDAEVISKYTGDNRIHRNFSAFNIRKNTLELYWPLGDGTRGLT
jgi:hypothetical protein